MFNTSSRANVFQHLLLPVMWNPVYTWVKNPFCLITHLEAESVPKPLQNNNFLKCVNYLIHQMPALISFLSVWKVTVFRQNISQMLAVQPKQTTL